MNMIMGLIAILHFQVNKSFHELLANDPANCDGPGNAMVQTMVVPWKRRNQTHSRLLCEKLGGIRKKMENVNIFENIAGGNEHRAAVRVGMGRGEGFFIYQLN